MNQEYNFFEELLKNISEENKVNNIEKCLITDEPLVEPIIKLECGHKFNYCSLKNEVIRQKNFINNYAICKLSQREIKCPYCRNIQAKILPYFENEEKIIGVNYPEKFCMKLNKCEYIFKSGKRKGNRCNRECNSNMCNQHNKIKMSKTQEKISEIKNKNYCKAIIKTGSRAKKMKNPHCLNACKKDGYCMLHYKLYNK